MDTRLVVTIIFVAAVAVNTAAAQNTTVAGNTTAAPNTTTATGTTALPTITADVLNTTISRSGCGTQQLCLAQPLSCDPSSSGSCYFLSAQTSGQNFQFGLSGSSTGYIAATLSPNGVLGSNDSTYICANNNNTVQFFTAVFSNGALNVAQLSANSVKGKVNGSVIQCTFVAPAPNTTTKAATPLTVAVATGTFTPPGTFGNPLVRFQSTVADLSNPNSTVTYSNTNSTNTTSHANAFQRSLTPALPILVGVLGMAML